MQQDNHAQLLDAINKLEQRTQDQERKIQEQERKFQHFQQHAGDMEIKLRTQAEEMETLFNQCYEQAMETAIQEIHDCVDDATDKFNAYVTTTMEPSQPAQPEPVPISR